MPDLSTLAVFSVAAMALLLLPGPAVFYIVARSIEQGRQAGVVSALGVAAGSMVHVAAAALGLSALLVTSAAAFTVVKFAGAAYLVCLGLQRLRGRAASVRLDAPPVPLRRVFAQGVVVNVLNPKTALFFLAFLPQFVEAGHGPVALQAAVLGMVFVVLGVCSDSCYAMLSGTVAARLRRGRSLARVQRWSGLVYLGLGLSAAVTGRPEKVVT